MKKPSSFRFNLSTCIVVSLASGIMLYLNFTVADTVDLFSLPSAQINNEPMYVPVRTACFGWPLQIIHRETELSAVDQRGVEQLQRTRQYKMGTEVLVVHPRIGLWYERKLGPEIVFIVCSIAMLIDIAIAIVFVGMTAVLFQRRLNRG